MSPSTAPPFCSLTRTAWIVPLTRPQTVTFCAMMLPSTCAPSLIWRSEARTSPSIRPKTCAGPLHSILPTIDVSEPMQEAVPAFVGSDLAQAWSCGCTVLPMTSAAFAAAFLSFSGTLLFMLFNLHLLCFAVQKEPKGCRAATSRKRRALRLGCRLRIGLRKPELPLRWSLQVRAIPCTVPCQGFHFLTIRASQHPLRP